MKAKRIMTFSTLGISKRPLPTGKYFFIQALLLFAFALRAFDAQAETTTAHVKASIVVDQTSLQPQDENVPVANIGVLLEIEPGWHTYWENSGEAAIPTKVTWTVPSEWHVGKLQWPLPEKFLEKGNLTTYGYREEVLLSSPLYGPQVIPGNGQTVHLSAKVNWLVCKDICVPGSANLEKDLPFSTSMGLDASDSLPTFQKYQKNTPTEFPELKKLPLFENTQFTIQANLLNERDLDILLVFRNISLPGDVETLSKQIQVFPAKSQSFRPKTARVSIQPNKTQTKNSDIFLTLPNSRSEEGDFSTTFEGVIAFAPELTKETNPISFHWSLPLSSRGGKLSDPPPAGEVPNSDGSQMLTYREVETHPSHSSTPSTAAAPKTSGNKSEPDTSLLFALFSAFIGGMILNLMPCVLPIISIKIMGFVGQADKSRASALHAALSFACGILVSFLSMAIAIVSLRSLGHSLGWGFQFQHPEFVAGLTLIVFFLSLSFFDFYNFNLPFIQKANKATSKVQGTFFKHFFDGVLATALSTPCTAPFLGTALAFAFVQPPLFTILVFLSIGLGLALPYVYFSTHPKLLSMLPTPGNWMFHFRQLMGFFLLSTVVWLLFVLHRLTEEGVVWGVLVLLCMFFCFWIRKIVVDSNTNARKLLLANLLLLAFFIFVTRSVYPDIVRKKGQPDSSQTRKLSWQDYSPAILEDAKNQHRTVFIDFTASWCITCKFNEFRIIDTEATYEAMDRYDILPLKADWTSGDELISEALHSYGGEGVPLYVIIPKNGGDPIVLSTLPSQSALLEAFQKASQE